MAALLDSKEILVDETERKPNRYAANVLAGVVGVITIVCALNEMGIFTLNRLLVLICLGISLLTFLAMRLIIGNPRFIVHPASKYVVMSIVLLLVLTLTVLLNIHAVLGFVLPLLLATQYRSQQVSRLALLGSCFCCAIAPILSYFLNTWNLVFMTGYIQTFCHVTINALPGNDITTASALWQILLYWSMPQIMTLLAFGIFLFSATRNSIASVQNQIQVADLSHDLSQQLGSILTMQEKVLYSMSDIIESRDLETGGHVRRTSQVVQLLTDAMAADPASGVSPDFCLNVVRSAPMHDLGKIAVPDAILRKPGPLTAAEYEIVKEHPVKSAAIIRQVLTGIEDEELLTTAVNLAKYHHERMDGTGYPEGLSGQTIPLEARIMAIADVYDALVSERCYKAPMAFDEAFAVIQSSMGSQFDPALNPYFLTCRRQIEAYYQN